VCTADLGNTTIRTPRRVIVGHVKKYVGIMLAVWLVSFGLFASGTTFDWRQFEGTTIVANFCAHSAYDAWIELIPQFEELTGITVEVDQMYYGNMCAAQLLEFVKPVGAYDLFSMVGPLWKTLYAYSGYLEPLEPLMANESLLYPEWDFDDFVDKLVQVQGTVCLDCSGKDIYMGGVEGTSTHLYAVPASSEVSVFAYRKDLFDEHNLDAPETMADVLELSKYFYENVEGVYGLTMRGETGHQAGHAFLNFAGPFGVKLFSDDWEPLFTSEGVLEVLRYYKQIVDYGPPGIPSFGAGGNDNSFLLGEAAMYFDHSRIATLVRDPDQSVVDGKVAYIPIPRVEGVDVELVAETGGFGIAIPSNSANKGAGFLLMQWMTSKDVERQMADVGIQIVDRLSIMEDPHYQELFPEYAIMVDQVKLADPDWRPAVPEWPEIETMYFGIAVNEVLIGLKTPEEAMAGIMEPVRKILEEAGYYD